MTVLGRQAQTKYRKYRGEGVCECVLAGKGVGGEGGRLESCFVLMKAVLNLHTLLSNTGPGRFRRRPRSFLWGSVRREIHPVGGSSARGASLPGSCVVIPPPYVWKAMLWRFIRGWRAARHDVAVAISRCRERFRYAHMPDRCASVDKAYETACPLPVSCGVLLASVNA